VFIDEHESASFEPKLLSSLRRFLRGHRRYFHQIAIINAYCVFSQFCSNVAKNYAMNRV